MGFTVTDKRKRPLDMLVALAHGMTARTIMQRNSASTDILRSLIRVYVR